MLGKSIFTIYALSLLIITPIAIQISEQLNWNIMDFII